MASQNQSPGSAVAQPGPGVTSNCSDAFDGPGNSFIEAAPQENLLWQAIKALAAEEIRADTVENIELDLAASHWRTAALFLGLAAKHAEAGDYLSAERNRRQARDEFNAANDVFRQFQEARATEAVSLYAAEAFR